MAAPAQSSQPDNSMGILWIIGATFVFGTIIWFKFKPQLIKAYFKIKLAEIDLISLFTNNLEDVRTTIMAADPAKFTFQEVTKLGEAVGDYLRIPFVIIIFILALIVYFTNSTRSFKRIYNMRDLALLEKENWPQISPVIPLDLTKTDIDKGPWAMALTPMQFCKRFKLIEEYKSALREGVMRKEWNRIEASLRRGKATKVFVMQLGPLFSSVHRLPLHVRALFAIFAARYNGDTQGAADLMLSINRSYDKKLNFSGTEALLKKHEGTKNVQQIIQSHAYVLTLMASMLYVAREDGVQASSDFLWLKPLDRRMWYMLNTIGRQTPFVEVAGPFAHWLAEREIGRPLVIPMVEEATNALEIALKEIVYRPDEPG